MKQESSKILNKNQNIIGDISLRELLDESHLNHPGNVNELKIQKQFFESLFNLSPLAIAILNLRLEIIHVNSAFIEMFGYKYEEMKYRSIRELTVPESVYDDSVKMSERVKQGDEVRGETIRKTKSGEIIDVSFVATKIVLDENDYAIYIIYRDITEEKRIENALLKERQYLRALLDNIPDTIYFKDTESRFTNVNSAQIKLLGADNYEAVVGKTDFDFFPRKHAEEAYKDEQKIIKTGIPLISKLEKIKIPSGETKWYLATKVPIFEPGSKNIIGIVGITRDIDDLETAKQNLHKLTDKLKQTNATKDKFFSIIAHDLKNPFNSLIGLSDFLKCEFENLDDNEKIEIITGIHEAAKSSYHLLENLLQWSRSQTAKIEFNPRRIILAGAVDEILKETKSIAKSKNVNIRSDIPEDFELTADENMIKVIIRNLVTNSIKYTNPQGHIKISCGQDDEEKYFIVEDNGIGMDAATKKDLFKLDVQHSTPGTEHEKGSGIGLLICDEFIKSHKGRIEVSSEPGAGSIFKCIFPDI